MSNTLTLLDTYYESDSPESPILTTKTVQSLYRQLMDINPNTAMVGICNEIDLFNEAEIKLLHALFKLWPEYSGDYNFPIKSPAHLKLISIDAYFIYSGSSLMWHPNTIYGAARRRLWAFCLSVLEEMVEDQSWAN